MRREDQRHGPGFIFGDGIYEVVPAYAGTPFRFTQHMARLERSLNEMRIANPCTREQWHAIALQLIAHGAKAAGVAPSALDQMVYIQITRGVAMRDHVMPTGLTPTVFAMANVMRTPSAEQRAKGVSCVTANDFRWEKAHIKSTSLLGAVFARQISFDADAIETVMFRNDSLSEAAASNVWVVKDGKVMGPPKDNLVLEGIRYCLIEEICGKLGIAFECGVSAAPKCLAPTNCCCRVPLKRCWPSPHWTVNLSDIRRTGDYPARYAPALHAAYQDAKRAE